MYARTEGPGGHTEGQVSKHTHVRAEDDVIITLHCLALLSKAITL